MRDRECGKALVFRPLFGRLHHPIVVGILLILIILLESFFWNRIFMVAHIVDIVLDIIE